MVFLWLYHKRLPSTCPWPSTIRVLWSVINCSSAEWFISARTSTHRIHHGQLGWVSLAGKVDLNSTDGIFHSRRCHVPVHGGRGDTTHYRTTHNDTSSRHPALCQTTTLWMIHNATSCQRVGFFCCLFFTHLHFDPDRYWIYYCHQLIFFWYLIEIYNVVQKLLFTFTIKRN